MDNLVLVHLWLESGCSQDDGEVSISWKPVNFMVYSDMFPEMIYEAIAEYLSTITLRHEELKEVLFSHVVDQDGAGAVLGEWFSPTHLKEGQADGLDR